MAHMSLDKYVQAKKAHGRLYYFFRKVKVIDGKRREFIRRLPYPLDDGYRAAYRDAWRECFGVDFDILDIEKSIGQLCRQHTDPACPAFSKLSAASKKCRIRAAGILTGRLGDFLAADIKPIHMQALYDQLAKKPRAANRNFDDISAIFAWGIPRGFVDTNPARTIERITVRSHYEPWPAWALARMVEQGHPHILRVFLLCFYTGQRRADVLQLCDAEIRGDTWHKRQGKTGNVVPVPLHPVALAILDQERARQRADAILDAHRPLLTNSRGEPWASGFGATWARELKRLDLRGVTPRLTLHGLRTTNATIVASEIAKRPDLYGSIEHVKSMLGHLSRGMSEHYARRAIQEQSNNESVLLLPHFGNGFEELGTDNK